MGRAPRTSVGGLVYHALNRANKGISLFEQDGDYRAFEEILGEAHGRILMRTLAYTLMPSHWHMVLWPLEDGDLSEFLRWVTLTHTQRRHTHRGDVGSGHLYQGRFKSFVVQEDAHFLTVCRYVERNPLRANMVGQAEDWRWSSLWRRLHPEVDVPPPLSEWPVSRPQEWITWANEPQTDGELAEIRKSVVRSQPFGSIQWVDDVVRRYHLGSTVRGRGRPKKVSGTFS